jgi:DNA repair protein RadC
LKIKDYPPCERPRERLISVGAKNLSTSELLTILLGFGGPQNPVETIAQSLITTFGPQGLITASVEQLTQVKGISHAKAATLLAAIEFGRRLFAPVPLKVHHRIRTLDEMYALIRTKIMGEMTENLYLFYLTIKGVVIKEETIIGVSPDALTLDLKTLVIRALKSECYGVMMAHNHPSGDLTPSMNDYEVTTRFGEALEMVGILLIDHLVVTGEGYLSLVNP